MMVAFRLHCCWGTAKDMTEEAKYCLSEAARCYRLARGCFDKKLIEIGDEFAARGMNLGADPLELPERWPDGTDSPILCS